MIERRIPSKVPLAPKKFRNRLRLLSVVCTTPEEIKRTQFHLLSELARDPSLSLCGGVPFTSMEMHHTGQFWEIILEAITVEP